MAAVIQIPYLNQLPADYKKAVKALNRQLIKSVNVMQKCKYLEAFTDKYTAVPEIFIFWERFLHFNRIDKKTMLKKRSKAFPQNYYKEWPDFSPNSYFSPMENSEALRNFSEGYLKQIISIPHSTLSAALECYDEISPVPLTSEMLEKYNTACKLYQQIKDAEISDGEKYIELLKKTDDDEFVIKNAVIKIHKNPWCQSLWGAYIHFLEVKIRDEKVLLDILRRYCRLFIHDKIMKEKYQSKIEEFSQTSVDEMTEFWIDSIKFEFDFHNVNAGKQLMKKVLNYNFTEENYKNIYDVVKTYAERYKFNEIREKAESIKKGFVKEIHVDTTRQLPTTLFDKNTKMQTFPLSKPISRYLYDKLSHQHLQKLYQTCKWFYYKYRYNLVHRLTIFTKIHDDFHNEWPVFQYGTTYPPMTDSAKLPQDKQDYINLIISVPHSRLSVALEFYDEFSPSPLTKEMIEKYKAACQLYQRIKNVDSSSDSEEYIELIKKANNKEYTIKSIEIQLCKYPWCQSLWLAYIQYLSENEDKDKKALLEVLSRYCRLFVNDKAMKEKYQTKIEEFSQTCVDEMTEFWIDSIKYEFDFQQLDDGKKLMEKALNYKFANTNLKAICDIITLYGKRYNFEDVLAKAESIKESYVQAKPVDVSKLPKVLFDSNTKLQKFPFSKPINQYLYDKIDHQHLHNFIKLVSGSTTNIATILFIDSQSVAPVWNTHTNIFTTILQLLKLENLIKCHYKDCG